MHLGEFASQLADQTIHDESPLGPEQVGVDWGGVSAPQRAGLTAEPKQADSMLSVAATRHR